jgi:serine/threonine-protein kinase
MIGKILAGRYELLEKVGEGGMARVYRGRDHLLRRTVAIKTLKDQMTGDADFVRRFRREAQSAAGLSHPHIVNIYDVGEEDGTYYMVMEYVDGKNLKQHIREKGRLPAGEAAALTSRIAEALAHAHAAGVIHRDIKPQNILFSRDGQIKVVDFGIAIAADGSTLTCSDNIIGSVYYFSPEQAKGSLAGKQSDLYSLGVILYEMVTGQVPFSGESPVSVAMKHVQEPITAPRRLVSDLPEPLERIILKALQKDPSARYHSAGEFLDDLNLFQQQGIARADTGTPIKADEDTRVMKPVRGDTKEKERPAPDPEKARQRGWVVPLLIIFFLSIALLAGFLALRDFIRVPDVTVPDVRGQSHAEAVRILKAAGLVINQEVRYIFDETIPTGYVVKTDPFQGRVVRKNRSVDLYISKGPQEVITPDLYLRAETEARIILEGLGLKPKSEYAYNDEVEEGKVFKQLPAKDARLAGGDEVVIFVSLGGRPFPIATLVGQTVDKAKSYLEEQGLKPRLRYEESDQPAGVVITQFPEPGSSVKRGQSVDLVISKGTGG